MMKNVFENYEEMGSGVLLHPSYMEYLKLISEYSYSYFNIVLSDQEMGMDELRIKTEKTESISDKITAFFVSIYETGTDGRGYTTEQNQLVLHNKKSNHINTIPLGTKYGDEYCSNKSEYKFLRPDLLEIIINDVHGDNKRYVFEKSYQYFKITDKNIEPLICNRYYTFTKYTTITPEYFKGCFVNYIDYEERNDETGENIWETSHVSLDDLDLMRNEIFAEYGYIFKNEKWVNYFTKKTWYKPQFENVDDKLTPIDKANLDVILQIKTEMEADELKFTKKKKGIFYEAG